MTGTTHPIHLHGHQFEVVKVGYPIYNDTGLFLANTPDIDCDSLENGPFCSRPRWTNPAWEGGNIPGALPHSPPRKDTIIVPAGGYVVVRLKADNPGTVSIRPMES